MSNYDKLSIVLICYSSVDLNYKINNFLQVLIKIILFKKKKIK